MRKRSPKQRERSPKQVAWAKSDRWRSIGRAAILQWHADRRAQPRCGALAKTTGQPCRNLPLPGRKRCKLHGGATPKGDGPLGWHTPAFPGGVPTGNPRSDAYKRRRTREQRERREAMTPEERARHDAWHAAHKPGSAAKRQRRRDDRKANTFLRELLEPRERPWASAARQQPMSVTDGPLTPRGGVFD